MVPPRPVVIPPEDETVVPPPVLLPLVAPPVLLVVTGAPPEEEVVGLPPLELVGAPPVPTVAVKPPVEEEGTVPPPVDPLVEPGAELSEEQAARANAAIPKVKVNRRRFVIFMIPFLLPSKKMPLLAACGFQTSARQDSRGHKVRARSGLSIVTPGLLAEVGFHPGPCRSMARG